MRTSAFGFIACARLMRGAFDTPRKAAYVLPTQTQGGDPGILHPPKVKVKDPKSETDNTLDPSTTPLLDISKYGTILHPENQNDIRVHTPWRQQDQKPTTNTKTAIKGSRKRSERVSGQDSATP